MFKRITAFLSPLAIPVILFIITVLAYGLLIPQLGFYWDDLGMSWIRYQLGTDAMTKYFSTNRPVWALLYQVTTRVFPYQPIYWQIFALVLRWLTAVLVWMNVRRVWHRFAFAAALLFLVYPGFNGQWASYLFSHFFIVLCFFLLSFYLTLRKRWVWTALAMLFSALNLWMMEYFFVLELTRLFWIWILLRDEYPDLRQRLRAGLWAWCPYLIVFASAVLSRLLIFNNQIYNPFSLREEFAKTPLGTIWDLTMNVLSSFWTTTVAAWGQIFQFPNPATDGPRTIVVYLAVVLITAFLIAYYALRTISDNKLSNPLHAIILGLLMLPFAGAPFYLTNVPVSLAFPASRAVLPFMLGVSLVVVGLLQYIPSKARVFILAMLIGLAAGRQFLWSNDFRRAWESQKNLFWQMTWRAPALEPGTIVMTNEELDFYADNSLGAPLNLIYAPDNHTSRVDYVFFYPTNRLGGALTSLEPNQPVTYDYLAGQFNGNTSQVVAFYYAPPKCLRLLDPVIDPDNHLIPDETYLRDAAKLSSTRPISNQVIARIPEIYYPEPVHTWCYYFEKADLARQLKDWKQVVKLGDKAFGLDDYPNDPVERFVFIEGYAHNDQWNKAMELSMVSYKVSKDYLGPLLCKLWDRIERDAHESPEQRLALTETRIKLSCSR
ncbi:MAG: hypothetical protein MUO77_11855 [Anaerolineales bacterium]|nr:hypothetical protein [Anaerolineales bacterium]